MPDVKSVRHIEHQSHSFVLGQVHDVAVHLQEGKRQDEPKALVAIDERLILGNTPKKRGRLLGEIGVGVVRGVDWPCKRRFEKTLIA